MKTGTKLAAVALACAALSVEAAPPAKSTQEVRVEIVTFTRLGPDGQQLGGRTRQVRLMLVDGKRVWSTLIGAPYTLYDGQKFERIEPNLLAAAGKPGSKTPPQPPVNLGPQVAIDHGILGKKIEEGIPVVGEWYTYPAAEGGPGIERHETWWRRDKNADGANVARIHRQVITTPSLVTRKDYWYLATDRLHPELFDVNP